MKRIHRAPMRATLPVIAIATLLGFSSSSPACAGEIVPQIGLSKPIDGDNDAKLFGGLALRGSLAPFLKMEIGASYRSEKRLNGNLDVRQWPITASLWLTPAPVIYAGAGVGWWRRLDLRVGDLIAVDGDDRARPQFACRAVEQRGVVQYEGCGHAWGSSAG